MKEDEMVELCSMHGEMRNLCGILIAMLEGRALGRPRHM
jgi:hypothetical protein